MTLSSNYVPPWGCPERLAQTQTQDFYCAQYKYLAEWLFLQTVQPITTSRSVIASTMPTYARNFNSSVATTKSGIVLFMNWLHFVAFEELNPPLALETIHAKLIPSEYYNFLVHDLKFAPASTRNHIEHVQQLLNYTLTNVELNNQERQLCNLAKAQYKNLASLAKGEEATKRDETMNIEYVQQQGWYLALEELKMASNKCCEVIQYYMTCTEGKEQDELYTYLLQIVYNSYGRRWIAIQKAIMYLLSDMLLGQRTQNMCNINKSTLFKKDGQYVFCKLAIEKNQHNNTGQKRMTRVMKTHYLSEEFTAVLDWWSDIVTCLSHEEKNDFWFFNFNLQPLNDKNYVVWFKEITFELFNKAIQPKKFRKNVITQAVAAAETPEEIKMLAELSSHSVATQQEYYVFRQPRAESSKVHNVLARTGTSVAALKKIAKQNIEE